MFFPTENAPNEFPGLFEFIISVYCEYNEWCMIKKRLISVGAT